MASIGTVIFGFTYLGILVVLPTRGDVLAAPRWWFWSTCAVIAVAGGALIMAGLSHRLARIRAVTYACSALYTALTLSWLVVWATSEPSRFQQVPDGGELWVIFIPQVCSCVLVLCDRPRLAAANLVLVGGAGLAAAAISAGSAAWSETMTGLWLLTAVAVYLVICQAVMDSARRFDRERVTAGQEAVDRLRSTARSAEQRQLDALVHDRLIALLLGLSAGRLSPALAADVTAALDELGRWPSRPDAAETISAAEFVQRMRLSVEELGERLRVEVRVGSRSAELPARAADCVIDAVGEAVRNVYRHAGSQSAGAVLCEVHSGHIAVVVIDDGVGFAETDVAPDRVGVAVGIKERMRRLDGGSARVVSRPGEGTRVELAWLDSRRRP